MDYESLDSMPYYKDCAPMVENLGYKLVELRVVPGKGTVKINAVIASKDPAVDIGVNDCSKVHHALLPHLESILGTEDTYMELTNSSRTAPLTNWAILPNTKS